MATLLLPTFTDPIHRYEVSLDGATYVLELRWNVGDEHWYLTLSDAEGEVLLAGLRVVPEWPLASRSADARLPPGRIYALSATRDDLRLAYVEARR